MKLHLRISPLYFAVLGLVLITFAYILNGTINSFFWSYDEYHKPYVAPDFSQYEESDAFRNTPNLENYFDSSREASRQIYEINKDFHKRQLYFDSLMIVFLSILMILLINIIIFTRVILDKKSLKVYFPPISALGPFAKPVLIDISQIESISVVRTTPLGPELHDLSKMNWRDNLEINGLPLSGFIFGGLGKLYTALKKLRPDLKTGYRKRTISENL